MIFSSAMSRLRGASPAFRSWCFVAGLIAAGLVMRGLVIDRFFFNAAETIDIDTASRGPLSALLSYLFTEEVHPPLYFLLLHALLQGNDSVLAIRMLMVLGWGLWVVACYCIGRELGNERTGLIWAAIAALGNGALEASLTVREYMWMLLLLTWQFYFFVRLCRNPSRRLTLCYFLCGLGAIGFEFCAAIPIFIMGIILGVHMLKARFRPRRLWLEVIGVHVLQAAFMLLLYVQYDLHKPGPLVWNNYYYFGRTSTAILLFYDRAIGVIVPMASQYTHVIAPGLFLGTIWPFWRRQPDMAAFFCISFLLMLVLNYFHLYPLGFHPRLITWMLPGIVAWFAFIMDWGMNWVPVKIRRPLALAAMTAVSAYSVRNYTVPYTATMEERKAFMDAAMVIQENDMVLMDVKTLLQLKFRNNWKEIAHYPHFDEVLWDKRTVFYPNWRKVDSVDIRTGQATGGSSMTRETIVFFKQMVLDRQREKSVPFIWVVQFGFPISLGGDCNAKFNQLGTKVFQQHSNFIARFTPGQFFELVAHCPARGH